MVQPEQPQHVEVHRSRSPRESREHALVLSSRRIPFVHVMARGEHVLAVPQEHESAARAELEGYAEENLSWPPVRNAPEILSSGKGAAASYALTIVLSFLLQVSRGYGDRWKAQGLGDAEAIEGGQWWRTFTSLTLHADIEHLASNLLFGSLFVAFASHILGTGVGLLALVLSGAIGNLMGVLLRDGQHLWLGASTAVFGAVGLITGFLLVDRRRKSFSFAYVLAPLICGFLFLGMHGMGNITLETLEQGVTDGTDILAHATGFVAGSGIGAVIAARATRYLGRSEVQRAAATLSLALLGAAWLTALLAG